MIRMDDKNKKKCYLTITTKTNEIQLIRSRITFYCHGMKIVRHAVK